MAKMTSVKKALNNYRAYYRVGFAGEKSYKMQMRTHEFLAKNIKDANAKVEALFVELAEKMGGEYKFFLNCMETFEVMKMRCPYCKGKKKFSVTLSSHAGKYVRMQTCQACNGAGKLPCFPSWKVQD